MNKGFKDLLVWQKSKDIAVYIYQITGQGQFGKDYGLRDQARRSAVSIPSNLAEGDERDTDKDAVRFFYMAKGSLAELRTQMEIAYEVGYLDEGTYCDVEERAAVIGKMIGGLIKARSQPNSP